MKRHFSVAMFLLLTQALWADQITLKNGDRLTGTILKSDTKELLLETPNAAKVTIQWDSIAVITADGPVFVDTTDDQTVTGAIRTENNDIVVTTQAAGVVRVPLANVKAMRGPAEQTQVERLRNPRLTELWSGFLDFGYAAARGNANTQTFTLASRADRKTNRDKTTIFFSSIFSTTNTLPPRQTTANAKIGGVTYDRDINKKWFTWAAFTMESDEFQDLDLRFVPSGGVGHHTINTEKTILDLRVGGAYQAEFFSTGLDRNSFAISIGDDFTHNFSKTTKLEQHLRLFPTVTNGSFRSLFDLSLVTEIAKWFALQFTFTDRYLSNPVQGRKSNDLTFAAGVRVNFGQPQ